MTYAWSGYTARQQTFIDLSLVEDRRLDFARAEHKL